MSYAHLIQLSHPIMGDTLLGILEAESAKAAQERLLELLGMHGMPEEHISYESASPYTIFLKGDIALRIFRSMNAEQWVHIIPLLIAYERT